MGEPSPGNSQATTPSEGRLESWKEIAGYLNRDVTTVQRWEKREGMPVHRHLHERIGSVYALKAELDDWSRSRNPEAPTGVADPPPSGLTTAKPRSAGILGRWIAGAAIAFSLFAAAGLWAVRTEYFWRSPIASARWEVLTGLDAVEEAASVSRDGKFVAFVSDRGGQLDVWVTQPGAGQFHNLTRGSAAEIVNPSVRTLGFSPDASLVTFWMRRSGHAEAEIGIWAAPTLGGSPRPYLNGVAEFDWSQDGTRLAYHTPGPGDPLFVSSGRPGDEGRLVYTAPAGLHCHFPLWSPDGKFIYFVLGSLPDKLDVWRIPSAGGAAEQITSHRSRVSHPVLLDDKTLLYLATASDGSGPWLYSIDVERRVPHRLTSGVDRFSSLAASARGERLVLTRATAKRTLWLVPIATEAPTGTGLLKRVPVTTTTSFAPRLGPDYLLHVSRTGTDESIWKIAGGIATELWRGRGARLIGGPSIDANGEQIAFSVSQEGRRLLYAMQADGTQVRVVCDSLALYGSPAWSPSGSAITTAAEDGGTPRLFQVSANGKASLLVREHSVDPAWSPDGRFFTYSGPDIGTQFAVKAAAADGTPYKMPPMTLTRGARRLVFLPGGREVIFLRGEIHHKNLWAINVYSGAQRQVTDVAPDFDIQDFDISPDGREAVLERAQERSEIVLLDRARD